MGFAPDLDPNQELREPIRHFAVLIIAGGGVSFVQSEEGETAGVEQIRHENQLYPQISA